MTAQETGGGTGTRPEGQTKTPQTTLTPHLTVRNAAGAIEFYTRAFGARELGRQAAPDGERLLHALLQFGSSQLMLNDEFPEMGACAAPQSLGGTTVTLHLEVGDADGAFKRAVEAGATVSMPLEDTFWGARYGKVTDPFGHEWSIGQQKEAPSEEEQERRMRESFAGAAPAPSES
jgi:PhnB protein